MSFTATDILGGEVCHVAGLGRISSVSPTAEGIGFFDPPTRRSTAPSIACLRQADSVIQERRVMPPRLSYLQSVSGRKVDASKVGT